MSIEALSWAWSQQGLSPSEKLVLLALADHADHDGVCWPGYRGVQEKTGLGRRTVIRALIRLKERGLVSATHRIREEGGQTTNIYRLHVHVKGGVTMTPPRVTVTPPRVTMTPPPCHSDTPPGVTVTPLEPTNKNQPLNRHRNHTPTPEKRTLSDEFRQRMRERFGPVLGGDIDERIDAALAHQAASRWTDLEKYVLNWLRRDAERAIAARRASKPNGRRHRGFDNSLEKYIELSKLDTYKDVDGTGGRGSVS